MVKNFPPFHSERKKRATSEVSLQFPNGSSRKLQLHLTFNRSFGIFLLNDKHPISATSENFDDVISRFLGLLPGNVKTRILLCCLKNMILLKNWSQNVKKYFDILACGKTDYHCKVKETLFIQEL